ncbi:MAG: sialidase family protein [Anaerolineae bacterium]
MNVDSRHVVVYHDPSKWAAVPANNGGNAPIWQWDDEILVGFTRGTFALTPSGHQCDNDQPFESWLARSSDGGESWATWQPAKTGNGVYAGHRGSSSAEVSDDVEALNFSQPGFVMRVEGNGYHGNSGARWFYSADKGQSWHGPWSFGSLLSHRRLEGREFTGRTAYLINGPQELYLFVSARQRSSSEALNVALREKPFVARTVDGGQTFDFVSWIVRWDDPDRAVMPAPVRLTSSRLVVAVRRKSEIANWIDCYESLDNGLTWAFLSRVGDTEAGNEFNGNPPALIEMSDGRLCCAYGHRSLGQIIARYSYDEGRTWTPGQIVRQNFQSANGWPDLGYVRLFQRSDGRLVAVYFWCNEEMPQTHIEATIFDPVS